MRRKETEVLSDQLGELLNVMSFFTRQTVMKWLPEITAREELTSDRYMILYELKMQPNISLKELSGIVMMAPSNLSVIIHEMVISGLVLREKDPQDRRRVQLWLTNTGMEKIVQIENALKQQFKTYLTSLQDDHFEALNEAVQQMMSVMQKLV